MSKDIPTIPGNDIDNLKKRLAACYEFATELLDAMQGGKTVHREHSRAMLTGIRLMVIDEDVSDDIEYENGYLEDTP